jgi:hypothetical protein
LAGQFQGDAFVTVKAVTKVGMVESSDISRKPHGHRDLSQFPSIKKSFDLFR